MTVMAGTLSFMGPFTSKFTGLAFGVASSWEAVLLFSSVLVSLSQLSLVPCVVVVALVRLSSSSSSSEMMDGLSYTLTA
jgi:hypothetical protein